MDSYIYEIYFAEITWMMGGLVMTILLKKEWNRISTIYILPKYFCYWKAWLFVGAEAIAWFSILNRISTIYISPKYLGSGFSKFYLRQCPLPTSRNTSSV